MHMQFSQSLKELFWNPAGTASLPALLMSLAVAAALGWILGQAYVRFGQSLSNRRLFARNFLLLTVTTTLIISIVKSSLALSLGLVGALSIVRFRAAIKEPEELAYLFLAISVGLGLGAGQGLVTVSALVLIVGLVALRSLFQPPPESPNLFLTVTCPAAERITLTQILETIGASGGRARIKRFDESPEASEVSLLVDFVDATRLEAFSRRLQELSPSVRLSCLDDRGLVA